jgi:hypothetical protein
MSTPTNPEHAPTPPADAPEPPWVAAVNKLYRVTWSREEMEATIRAACIAHGEAHSAALAQELLDTRAYYVQAFADRERLTAERDRLRAALGQLCDARAALTPTQKESP